MAEAQVYLKSLGFSAGVADGIWGANTRQALDNFRRQADLPVGVDRLTAKDRAALFARVHGVPPTSGAAATATTREASVEAPASGEVPPDEAAQTAPQAADGAAIVAAMQGNAYDGPARAAAPPEVAADRWLHIGRGAYNRVPAGFEWTMALRHIKHDPGILDGDNDDLLRRLYIARQAEQSGMSEADVGRTLAAKNALEQTDILNAFRIEVRAKAEAVPDLSADNPMPVAVYIPASVGAFEAGAGLPVIESGRVQAGASSRRFFGVEISLTVDRDEAKAVLDAVADVRADGERLAMVVSGEITDFGTDAKLADFARGDRAVPCPRPSSPSGRSLFPRHAAILRC